MAFRYKIILTYDGTNFAGFQRQPHQRTVESELTKAVNKLAKSPKQALVVYGAGRTDSGVHALGQVVHFDLPYKLTAESVRKGLNSMLPLDMEVLKVEQVPLTFHARYDTVGKRYVYRVAMEEFVNPFKRNYTGHYKYRLDPALIEQALPDLVGTHDFSSFVASGSQAKNHVRTIYSATMKVKSSEHELVFEFCGSGFLYNQVRIMVAALLEIGNGKRAVHDFLRLYKVKDRQQARGTAPAAGLYMKKVYYEKSELLADLKSEND